MTILSGPSAHPLFSRCPALREGLSHVPLGTFPTPVERLDALGRELGVGELWVKRDDRSGIAYGGNKVRKLEFLLADALRRGAREVVTFGGVGSNHALASAIYGKRLGFAVTLFLTPQPVSHHVRRTLLAGLASGADIRPASSHADAERQAAAFVAEREAAEGVSPYVIPLGGSTPTTAAALMDAGLELNMQVFQGELPMPDVLYVAMGSMGTVAGITLGLAITGAPTRVRGVLVTPPEIASAAALDEMLTAAADAVCGLDSHCDCTVGLEPREEVVEDFFGAGYGVYSPEGVEAARLAATAGLALDGTYTAKAFAALVADARSGALADKRVVFWNTFSSVDLSPLTDAADYRELPEALHQYFEQDVQPLDRA
jgi:D-cysteine desulfhydrase